MSRIPNRSQDHPDQILIQQAAQFAIEAHAGQVRKVGGQPYFFHPLAVGRILLEAGMEPEVVAAGLLHDVVEDTGTTLAQIEERFGARISGWVADLTEPDKSKPWRVRKQSYLKALGSATDETVMISLADKRDNLRSLVIAAGDLGSEVWEKFTRPKPDQRWYYQELLAFYSRRILDPAGQSLLDALQQDFERLFDQ